MLRDYHGFSFLIPFVQSSISFDDTCCNYDSLLEPQVRSNCDIFLSFFLFIELDNIKVATEVAITKTATNYSNYICKIDIKIQLWSVLCSLKSDPLKIHSSSRVYLSPGLETAIERGNI